MAAEPLSTDPSDYKFLKGAISMGGIMITLFINGYFQERIMTIDCVSHFLHLHHNICHLGSCFTGHILEKTFIYYHAFGYSPVCLRFDGYTGTFQDKLFKGYDMEIHNQIFYTTMCSCILSFTGKFSYCFFMFNLNSLYIFFSIVCIFLFDCDFAFVHHGTRHLEKIFSRDFAQQGVI